MAADCVTTNRAPRVRTAIALKGRKEGVPDLSPSQFVWAVP